MFQLHYGQKASKSRIRLAFLLIGAVALGATLFFGQKHLVRKYEEWRFRSEFQRLFEEEKLSKVFTGNTEDFLHRKSMPMMPGWDLQHPCAFAVARDENGIEHYLVVGFETASVGKLPDYHMNFFSLVPRTDAAKSSDLPRDWQFLGRIQLLESSSIVVGPHSILRGPPDVVQITVTIDNVTQKIDVGVGSDGRAWGRAGGAGPFGFFVPKRGEKRG